MTNEPRPTNDSLDRYDVCRELIKVVTDDFPRGHTVENITAMVIARALRRILDLPAEKTLKEEPQRR